MTTINGVEWPTFAVWRKRLEIKRNPQREFDRLMKAIHEGWETVKAFVKRIGEIVVEAVKAIESWLIQVRHTEFAWSLKQVASANSRPPDPVWLQRRHPRVY